MSMMIIYLKDTENFVVIPYRRSKGESFEYASKPVVIVPKAEVEAEVFNRLGADLAETKVGVEPDRIQKLAWSEIPELKGNEAVNPREYTGLLSGWSRDLERELLTGAIAFQISPKKIVGGFADVIRFTPCIISQKRLHKILNKNPSLNIEVAFPMAFEDFSEAFQLTLGQSG